jgi:hypothetical protein
MNYVLGICFDQKSFYVSIFCALFGNLKNKIMTLKCFLVKFNRELVSWYFLAMVGQLVSWSVGGLVSW